MKSQRRLSSTDAYRAIPRYRTKFFGREKLLAQIAAVFKRARGAVLLGPPGIGKTRLAVEFARSRSVSAQYRAVFVCLNDARDEDGLRTTLAVALGKPAMATSLAHALAAAEPLFVVLDGVDKLSEILPRYLADWQAAARRHRWLVTSRRSLDSFTDSTIQVGGLDVWEDERQSTACAAGQLFLDRACRVEPGWQLDSHEHAALSAIIKALEGHPLGLELAAGRLSLMSLAELAALLRADPSAITASTAAAQRVGVESTLWAGLEMSWSSLPSNEVAILEDISVLVGAFGVEDARNIVREQVRKQPAAVLDGLQSLCNQGFVTSTETSGRTSFRLPCWVHDFVSRRGDRAVRQQAGRRWAHQLGEFAAQNSPPTRTIHLAAISAQWDALYRLATLTLFDNNVRPYNDAARAALALDELLFVASDLKAREALIAGVTAWSRRAAAHLEPYLQARLHLMEGRWLFRAGELRASQAALLRAVELGRQHDRWALARAALSLTDIVRLMAQLDESDHWLAVAEEELADGHDPETLSICVAIRGVRNLQIWRLPEALRFSEQMIAHREVCHSTYLPFAYAYHSIPLRYMGEFERARLFCERALQMAADFPRGAFPRAVALHTMGVIDAQAGHFEAGAAAIERCLEELKCTSGALWYREASVEAAAIAEVRGELHVARSLWTELAAAMSTVNHPSIQDALCAMRLAAGLAIHGDIRGATHWIQEAERLHPEPGADDVLRTLALHRCRAQLAIARLQGDLPAIEVWQQTAREALAEASLCGSYPPGLWHGRHQLAMELNAYSQSAQRGNAPSIEVRPDGRIQLPSGAVLDLSRRPVAQKILLALLQHAREHPETPMAASALVEAVWPTDTVPKDVILGRLYVAIRDLRKIGLDNFIDSSNGGYLLKQSPRTENSQPLFAT